MGNFLHFYHTPPKTPKNKNFEKMKKNAGDIITLHQCTKNHNQMRDDCWDTECKNRLFIILGHFLPFYHQRTQKIKILKK